MIPRRGNAPTSASRMAIKVLPVLSLPGLTRWMGYQEFGPLGRRSEPPIAAFITGGPRRHFRTVTRARSGDGPRGNEPTRLVRWANVRVTGIWVGADSC